jgi:hypothetical protein
MVRLLKDLMTSSQASRFSKLHRYHVSTTKNYCSRSSKNVPCKTNAAAMAIPVTKNASRAHLVRSKEVAKLVLVHALREVRHIEVGVELIGEGLELRVEGLLEEVVSGKVKDVGDQTLTLAKLTS